MSYDGLASGLKCLHDSIMLSIEQLHQLNLSSREKCQDQYLRTFLKVMNRMSGEVTDMKSAIQTFKAEEEKDEVRQKLEREAHFFKTECIALRKQLKAAHRKLDDQKNELEALIQQNETLKAGLFRKTKQALKYKTRSLPKARNESPDIKRSSNTTVMTEKDIQVKNLQKVMRVNSCSTADHGSSEIRGRRLSISRKLQMSKTYVEGIPAKME